MVVDWPQTPETSINYHQAGPNIEPSSGKLAVVLLFGPLLSYAYWSKSPMTETSAIYVILQMLTPFMEPG